MKIKIARQAYRRSRQSYLASFTENVIARTKGVAEYASLEQSVEALSLPLQQYVAALAASLNRGKAEVATKNAAMKILVAALDEFVDALEKQAADNELLIIGAGFSLQLPSVRSKGILSVPSILRASSTGRKGEIRVQLTDESPNKVLIHSIEYSEDKGGSWKNGSYHNHNNFVLNGLPSSSDLWLRFKSLGRGNNKSDWSEPMTVAVL